MHARSDDLCLCGGRYNERQGLAFFLTGAELASADSLRRQKVSGREVSWLQERWSCAHGT